MTHPAECPSAHTSWPCAHRITSHTTNRTRVFRDLPVPTTTSHSFESSKELTSDAQTEVAAVVVGDTTRAKPEADEEEKDGDEGGGKAKAEGRCRARRRDQARSSSSQ